MVILIYCLHYKSHLVLVEQRCVHADISHAYSSRETTTFSSKILLGYFIWCPCKKGLSLVCSYLLQNGCRQCGTPVLLCGCYATVQLALFFKASFFKCTHHAHPHTRAHTQPCYLHLVKDGVGNHGNCSAVNFGSPYSCQPPDCDFTVAWVDSGQWVNFSLTAAVGPSNSSVWAAVGFSGDTLMVCVCVCVCGGGGGGGGDGKSTRLTPRH